jgi:hypothetical protein
MPYKNPEDRTAYQKAYRLKNAEKLNAYDKKRHADNPQRKKDIAKAWRLANPDKYKQQIANQLAKNKGKPGWLLKKRMTRLEFDAQLQKQNNCCALCKRPFTSTNPPVLDHNHATGKNRGLLHLKCNCGIGFFEDNLKICKLAVRYLEEYAQ